MRKRTQLTKCMFESKYRSTYTYTYILLNKHSQTVAARESQAAWPARGQPGCDMARCGGPDERGR